MKQRYYVEKSRGMWYILRGRSTVGVACMSKYTADAWASAINGAYEDGIEDAAQIEIQMAKDERGDR